MQKSACICLVLQVFFMFQDDIGSKSQRSLPPTLLIGLDKDNLVNYISDWFAFENPTELCDHGQSRVLHFLNHLKTAFSSRVFFCSSWLKLFVVLRLPALSSSILGNSCLGTEVLLLLYLHSRICLPKCQSKEVFELSRRLLMKLGPQLCKL